MGRPKSIDREALLDVAEEIVRTRGAAALTIDAVAKAAGITKGGVQYTFASKAEMIEAISARWMQSYGELFARFVGDDHSMMNRVRAHIAATFEGPDTSDAKAVSLMTGLLQSPEFMAATRDWYQQRLAEFDITTAEGRRARLAFFATEGAFCLRFLGLAQIDEPDWMSVYDDIKGILPPSA